MASIKNTSLDHLKKNEKQQQQTNQQLQTKKTGVCSEGSRKVEVVYQTKPKVKDSCCQGGHKIQL